MLQKIKKFILSHKIIIGIALIGIAVGAYFIFRNSASGETRYVTEIVEKGNVIVSVTGSGQVEASNTIDIKPKTSGKIVYIGVKAGDVVKKGRTLFSLDTRDAQKAVRDAEISLESAKLSLEKLKIQNSDENISADLQKAYDDGFSAVSDTFLDLSSTLTGLENIFGQQNLSDNAARISGKTAQNYRDMAEKLYYEAQNVFWQNRKNFRILDRNSPKTDIENIINETYDTIVILSDAIKSTKNFVDYLAEDTGRASDFTSSQTTLSGYTSTINSHLSSLSTAQTNIKNYKDTSVNSGLDIKSSLLSVQQKENSLQDAKDALSDYYVSAPFDGTISSVVVKIGDTASGTLATIITNQKLATISLNEVDIAKIKLGQKATLSFDAIDELTITGQVAEIDSVGTVSQGVVTYNVKISFDVMDNRIKPGMSVSATIITDIAQDVLVIPNSAVKSQNGVSYVEMFDTPLVLTASPLQGSTSTIFPKQIKIETGFSNDTLTEIISGLKEGDIIITKTITNATKMATTPAPSIFGSMTGGSRSNNSGARNSGGFAVPRD
jgi:HlyD family secretion protein